jgi:hypothetical protein
MQNPDLEEIFNRIDGEENGPDAPAGSGRVVDLKRRRRIEDMQEERRLRRMLEDPWT